MSAFKRPLKFARQTLQLLLLVITLGSLTAIISFHTITHKIDWFLYDAVQQLSQLSAPDDVLIIDIDEKSINALGRWPWTRDVHAQLLKQLTKAGAEIVVFDVIFSDSDAVSPASDQLFADAIDQHGRVLLPMYIRQIGLQGQVQEVTPALPFYQAAKRIGHVHVAQDEDGVVRSVFLKEGIGLPYWSHLALALWQELDKQNQTIPGSRNTNLPNVENLHVIARDYHNFLPMPGAQQGMRHYSYIDVLEGMVDAQALNKNIIFIGASAAGLGDNVTTSIGSLSGVELNAWVFHALRSNTFIKEIPINDIVLIQSVLVFILLLVLAHLSPRAFFMGSVTAIIALLVINASLQLVFYYWLPITPTLIAIVIFYPLWSWWRLELALGFLRNELSELNELSDFAEPTPIDHAHINCASIHSNGTELVAKTIERLAAIKKRAHINRRLLQQSMAQLHDGLVISDLSGHILFANNTFDSLSARANHYTTDLLEALKPIELENNQQWETLLQDLFQQKLALNAQGLDCTHKKSVFCQGHLLNIKGDSDDTLIITITDVSQLKAAEQSRTEALNFLSHDLRSPMVSVLAIIERWRNETTIDNNTLNPIEVLVRKNLEYADSFLQLNRAESLQSTQLHVCDLHSIFDYAQMHALALADSKHITVIAQRIDEDAWVLGDNDLLERAVINLLSNAVKYSPAASTITMSLCAKANQFHIVISDQGCGIARDDIPHLFDRYTRGNRQQTQMGAGLGLYFVATVAQQHQGAIHVDSTEGEGSVFTLVLNATL